MFKGANTFSKHGMYQAENISLFTKTKHIYLVKIPIFLVLNSLCINTSVKASKRQNKSTINKKQSFDF